MPFKSNSELPDKVKQHLPDHPQDIFRAAFNHAWEEYENPEKRRGEESQEEVCFKVAWAAVKQKYHKEGEQWKANS